MASYESKISFYSASSRYSLYQVCSFAFCVCLLLHAHLSCIVSNPKSPSESTANKRKRHWHPKVQKRCVPISIYSCNICTELRSPCVLCCCSEGCETFTELANAVTDASSAIVFSSSFLFSILWLLYYWSINEIRLSLRTCVVKK